MNEMNEIPCIFSLIKVLHGSVCFFDFELEYFTHVKQELNDESTKRGLEMNQKKTKIMTNKEKEPIMIGNTQISYTDEYIYLGQTIAFENRLKEEVHRRITLAWSKYWSLKKIMKGNISDKTKGDVLRMCVFPTLTYGCQTWAPTQREIQKIAVTQNQMQRSSLNIKKEDKVQTGNITKRLKIKRIENIIRKLKFKWAGHLMRADNNKWSKITTEWIPLDKKRNKGRQRRRWMDEIRKEAGKGWTTRTIMKKEWKMLCKKL